jgi:hypothetical protein
VLEDTGLEVTIYSDEIAKCCLEDSLGVVLSDATNSSWTSVKAD